MVPQQQRRRRRRAALVRTAERRVVVARGAEGFGFTIAGQRPCVVSAVAAGGPAERAGLRAGDALLAVDGASVARAPHAAVARLVAAAPGAIALSVIPREAPPTDTEDTEPDERARTRRRHPPPRRRPQPHPLLHHPGCHAAPSTSGVNEILQNLSRAQLTPSFAARLECRAVVGYLGTIETPQGDPSAVASNVRMCVRKLRQERRAATPVLICVLPNALTLRRGAGGPPIATYERARILHAGCPSEADTRHFGLVTASSPPAHCTHVFAVDPRAADHATHQPRARDFNIECTRDTVSERCLEFPPSAEYVVGVIRGMYSLPPDDSSPALMQISKLAIKGDSPAAGDFCRARVPRDRRAFIANSPQPSNHSEITTTSSNSDSGIGFHNDYTNIADRILVVDFAAQPPINKLRQEAPRRPVGMVGCLDTDGLFLSNTTPVVDGFGGQGRPLNLDDVMLNASDVRMRHVRCEEDSYSYVACGSERDRDTQEFERQQFECERDSNGQEFECERDRERQECESVECVSVYSARSLEERGSTDDLLREQPSASNEDTVFLHPANVKCKVRKSKPLNILSKTRNILLRGGERRHERERERERRRALSASAGDVAGSGSGECSPLPAAASEPDLRDTQSEQSSPFRRWTTGSGAGSSYRHAEHRPLFNKQQMSEGGAEASGSGQWPHGGVARWSLGLDQLLADPAGGAAFSAFLRREYAHENIVFWVACENYSQVTDPASRAALAQEIWERHLADGAPEPVNIDADARRYTMSRLGTSPSPPDLFVQEEGNPCARPLLTTIILPAPPEFTDTLTRIEFPSDDEETVDGLSENDDDDDSDKDKAIAETKILSDEQDTSTDNETLFYATEDEQKPTKETKKHVDTPIARRRANRATVRKANKSILKKIDTPIVKTIDTPSVSRADIPIVRQAEKPVVNRNQTPSVRAKNKTVESQPSTSGKPGASSTGQTAVKSTQSDLSSQNFPITQKLIFAPEPQPSRRTDPVSGGYPLEPHVNIKVFTPKDDEKDDEIDDEIINSRIDNCRRLEAQRQIYNMMRLDLYPRFLRSGVHAECARADLRGLPPPYAPDAGAAAATGDNGTATPTKVKKCPSSACERRRSGSLLPWLRVAARERAAGTGSVARAPAPAAGAAAPATSPAQPPADAAATPNTAAFAIADVVRGGALCRVVLPDGATSVVGVDSQPVRRLVERLLSRRNLPASNYDVLFKDARPGENAVIDLNQPSHILGGREVVVERRCVVRVEVRGTGSGAPRCVAVRCRPARRLRHVLRPVLARYAIAPHATVLKDGEPLHPDTPMEELDGARLQIVELPGECHGQECLEEGDSPRLHDLDGCAAGAGLHSALSSSAVAASSCCTAQALAATPAPAQAEAGRVRAALKPGPPLHHHPPDFLENLRETQRQRLTKGEPSNPPARTPPPLPPKPSRAPTLV